MIPLELIKATSSTHAMLIMRLAELGAIDSFVSYPASKVSEDLNISLRSAQKILKDLIDQNYLEVKKERTFKSNTNLYKISLRKIDVVKFAYTQNLHSENSTESTKVQNLHSERDPIYIYNNILLNIDLIKDNKDLINNIYKSLCKFDVVKITQSKSKKQTAPIEYPKSVEDTLVYFKEYINSHLDKQPYLTNIPDNELYVEAERFFLYWQGSEWKRKNTFIEDIPATVRTWIGNSKLFSNAKYTQSFSTRGAMTKSELEAQAERMAIRAKEREREGKTQSKIVDVEYTDISDTPPFLENK